MSDDLIHDEPFLSKQPGEEDETLKNLGDLLAAFDDLDDEDFIPDDEMLLSEPPAKTKADANGLSNLLAAFDDLDDEKFDPDSEETFLDDSLDGDKKPFGGLDDDLDVFDDLDDEEFDPDSEEDDEIEEEFAIQLVVNEEDMIDDDGFDLSELEEDDDALYEDDFYDDQKFYSDEDYYNFEDDDSGASYEDDYRF